MWEFSSIQAYTRHLNSAKMALLLLSGRNSFNRWTNKVNETRVCNRRKRTFSKTYMESWAWDQYFSLKRESIIFSSTWLHFSGLERAFDTFENWKYYRAIGGITDLSLNSFICHSIESNYSCRLCDHYRKKTAWSLITWRWHKNHCRKKRSIQTNCPISAKKFGGINKKVITNICDWRNQWLITEN